VTGTHSRTLLILGVAWLAASLLARAELPPADGTAGRLLHIRGPIGPAVSDFFVRQLAKANEAGESAIVVTIDTPGGLDTSMRDMVQAIVASNVPVLMYVSPGGARAASAGTYLLYASHIAAMAPGTNLGAATPVAIGGPGGAPRPGTPEPPRDEDKPAPTSPATEPDAKPSAEPSVAPPAAGPQPADASERKAINDAVAYLRSLAELRGRNVEWAERAVREGASLSSSQALQMGVVDIVADDVADVLAQADGREVHLGARKVKLATRGLSLSEVQPDWRTELLALITNPNVAYLFMLIGIYGLLAEAYNPGAILPGVVGAICLLLALFAFQVLSVNYAGLALIALGVLLIVAEAFVPAFGALGLGGIVAFVIGSIILLDSDVPGFDVAWQMIGAMAFAGALVIAAITYFAMRSRRRPQVTGQQTMLSEPAEAVESFQREGMVRVRGELWQAASRVPVARGQRLRIVRVNGLKLEVEPQQD
jgi:membrane-bound serine protease (ClpP class)